MNKETDSYIVAKEVKAQKFLPFVYLNLTIFFLIIIMCLLVTIKIIQQGEEVDKGDFVYEAYDMYSEKYSQDNTIKLISNKCKDNDDKIKCVFDSLPLNYDYSRVGNPFPIFRTPDEYFAEGGVCRDVSVLRHSALINLNINCLFDFSEPNHVFLLCSDGNKIYELNNQYLIER
jgi:hypothetical protein